MLSLFLALIATLITIPVGALKMGYELKKHKEKKDKGIEESNPLKPGGILKKLYDKRKSDKEYKKSLSGKEKVKDALIDVSIKILQALVTFLRSLSMLLSACGVFSIFFFGLIFIVIVAAMAGIIATYDEGFSTNPDSTEQVQEQKNKNRDRTSDSLAGSDFATNQTQFFGDNSSWQNCCLTVWNWYYGNIKTYCTKYPGEEGYGKVKWGRGYYTCELFPGTQGAGDDCSSYVSNCLVYAGFLGKNEVNKFSSQDFTEMHKVQLEDGTETWEFRENSTLRKYFNCYTYEDYQNGTYIPRAGDIKAKKGHVEIIAETSPTAAWSWGKVADASPCPRGDLSNYLAGGEYVKYWSLKDNVLPESYLEGKQDVPQGTE
jgi:hypothetical protein